MSRITQTDVSDLAREFGCRLVSIFSRMGPRLFRSMGPPGHGPVMQGGTVAIGDRRRQPVARLVPFHRSADRDVLDQLAAHGVIQRGGGKPGRGPRVKPRPG